jgi:hypothetical protein
MITGKADQLSCCYHCNADVLTHWGLKEDQFALCLSCSKHEDRVMFHEIHRGHIEAHPEWAGIPTWERLRQRYYDAHPEQAPRGRRGSEPLRLGQRGQCFDCGGKVIATQEDWGDRDKCGECGRNQFYPRGDA